MIAGILALAVSMFMVLVPGSDLAKDWGMRHEIIHQALDDPRIKDALRRVKEGKRFWHDRKNLVIEIGRFLLKTWELQNESWVASFVWKAIAATMVGGMILSLIVGLLIGSAFA